MQNLTNLMESVIRFGSIMNLLLSLKLIAETISANKMLGNLFGLTDEQTDVIQQKITTENKKKQEMNYLTNSEKQNIQIKEENLKQKILLNVEELPTTTQNFQKKPLFIEPENNLKSDFKNTILNTELLFYRLLAAQQEQQQFNASMLLAAANNSLNCSTLNSNNYFLTKSYNNMPSFNYLPRPSTSVLQQTTLSTVEQLHEREKEKVFNFFLFNNLK